MMPYFLSWLVKKMLVSHRCNHLLCRNVIRKLNSSYAPLKVLDNTLNPEGHEYKESCSKSIKVKKALDSLLLALRAGGGEKAIHKHTVFNKKILARDRLKLLFDKDSTILEIAPLAGFSMDYGSVPAAGCVVEIGKIHGHYCIAGANDATVKGGTFFPISVTKQIRTQEIAFLNKLPCIYIVDSGGAFLPLQSDIFPDRDHGGRVFHNEAVMSAAAIPQIAIVCGSCTAGGAYCPTMAEEAIIVKDIGTLYLGGPPLVKAATGEIVSDRDLGGAEVHCRISGCTDYYAENEEEAMAMCRESVFTLNLPQPEEKKNFSEPLFPVSDLMGIASKELISKADMYQILARLLDGSMFKEFKSEFGHNLITGFGFVHGHIVGILANCCQVTSPDALKGCHFIQICQKRSVPLIFLQNSGIKEKTVSWSEGRVLKDRAKMVAAHVSATVPKITINVGGCHNDDNYIMCGWSFKPNFLFSWPLAYTTSSLEEHHEKASSEFKSELATENFNEKLQKLFQNKSSAFYRSSHLLQDGIINPEDTRKILGLCLDISLTGFKPCKVENDRLAVFRM